MCDWLANIDAFVCDDYVFFRLKVILNGNIFCKTGLQTRLMNSSINRELLLKQETTAERERENLARRVSGLRMDLPEVS